MRDDVAVILMDEPMTVIDPQLKFHLRRKLKDISARHGQTLVYVTHDQNEAMTLAEQVIVMDNGRITQIGTPQELFENPSHTHVGYFIGSPSMNFFKANLVAGQVRVGTHVIETPFVPGPQPADTVLGIRPEFVHIVDAGAAGEIVAVTRDVQDFGPFHVVTAKLPSGETVRVKTQFVHVRIGERVGLSFERDAICLFSDDKRLVEAA